MAIFLIAIFFGNIHFFITLPLSIVLLPLIMTLRLPITIKWHMLLPVLLFVIVPIQWLSGHPLTKADVPVYLSCLYSLLVIMVAASQKTIKNEVIMVGIVSGGLMIAFWMIGNMLIKMPHGFHFYEVKNLAVTSLGSSNYLAVFMLFSIMLTLYKKMHWISALLIVGFMASFSRTGYVMIVMGFLIWLIDTKFDGFKKRPLLFLIMPAVILSSGIAWLYLFPASLPESLAARVTLWHAAIAQVAENPVIGTPRSYYLPIFNGLAWDPHNAVLNVALLYGSCGLLCYGLYVFYAVRLFAKLASKDIVWRAILCAVVVTLVWSLFEVVVLTPAYDILFASLFGFASVRFASLEEANCPTGSNDKRVMTL